MRSASVLSAGLSALFQLLLSWKPLLEAPAFNQPSADSQRNAAATSAWCVVYALQRG